MRTSRRWSRSVRTVLVIGSVVLPARWLPAATIIVPDDNPSLVAAVASAAAGDTVQVRPGNYTERVTVVAGQDGLVIEGLGGRPLFTPANRKEGFRIDGANGVTVRGFDFDGRLSAVRIKNCQDCLIDDIVASNCREGLRAKYAGGLIVLNSTFANVTDKKAIRIDRAPGAFVGSNVVTSAKSEGIYVFTADGAAVVDNTITGASRGIRTKGCANLIVGGNVVSGSRREGMVVEKAPMLLLGGNQAFSNGADGFEIDDAPGAAVTINTATDNRGYGFDVDDSPPIATEADLTGALNTASGNARGNFLVR